MPSARCGVRGRRLSDLRAEISDEVRLVAVPELARKGSPVDTLPSSDALSRFLDPRAPDHPLWRDAYVAAEQALKCTDRHAAALRQAVHGRDIVASKDELRSIPRNLGAAVDLRQPLAQKSFEQGHLLCCADRIRCAPLQRASRFFAPYLAERDRAPRQRCNGDAHEDSEGARPKFCPKDMPAALEHDRELSPAHAVDRRPAVLNGEIHAWMRKCLLSVGLAPAKVPSNDPVTINETS